jgi:hypothetical protein
MEKEYCAMNLRLQILLLFLTSIISSINATPVFTKFALPNYELSFSKIEYVKLEGDVKIGSSKIWEEFGKKGIVRKGSWMDGIYNLQKSVVNQNKNIIANASNNAKGAWSEMASDVFLTEKGFQPLHRRKSALTEGWGETGIDGIFKKNGQYYIVEAKYTGSATLNTAADGKQLSNGWIEGSNRLRNAVGETMAREIRLLGYKKIWAKVAT